MKNSKKILSIALTLAMLMSAIFCTGAVANAEDATTPAASAVLLTHSTTEADMDWEQDAFGPNLIPDSTVAEWTQDAKTQEWTYNNYYNSSGTVENANAWWGSKSLSNDGYEGPAVNGYVTKEDSHTADGSGALHRNTLNNWWYIPLRSMSPDYYVITFWAKANTDTSATFVAMSSYGEELGARLELKITTDWQRFTVLTYANNGKYSGKFMQIGNWSKVDLTIDEIEQYKVTREYAEACIAAGNKLLNGKESYTSSDTASERTVTIASGFDFSTLGTNLAPDPTVAAENFADDGTGKMVYSDSGIYSQVLFGNDAAMWKSPKYHGAPVLDTANSHTADGSGVLKYDMTGKSSEGRVIRLATSAFDAYSYYLVTAWVKSSIGSVYKHNIRYDYGSGNIGSFGTTWTQISYIVYTGKFNYANGLQLYLQKNSITYVDDIAVYRLDAKYGSTCKSKSKLLTVEEYEALLRESDATISSDHASLKINSAALTPIDTESLGKNLVTDPTVSAWDGDTYSATGWWTKRPFSNVEVYNSMEERGFLTNDTSKSHTKDGSGAIVKPSSPSTNDYRATVYLPLTLPKLKTYYLVTAWVKSSDKDVQSGFYTYGSTLLGKAKVGETIGSWRQVAWIVYQGGVKIDAPSMCFFSMDEIYIDEFSIYELDYEFGKKCIDAKAWATGASSKEDVAFNANATKTITATDGYFIPYGAVQTADGKIAEKLGNGQFYATTAGDYSCAEFKYPTGTVGTFGASAKTTGTTGIQFGSLITDNLNVEANGTGTLVFRGDFDAFRKTFPTKTRAEVANIIYNALNNANVPDGKAVTLNNGGKSVVVMNVPRKTYMWKNSANTELQYAVRVTNIVGNAYESVNFTAIGYVTKGGKLEFSNEIKTANYAELNK